VCRGFLGEGSKVKARKSGFTETILGECIEVRYAGRDWAAIVIPRKSEPAGYMIAFLGDDKEALNELGPAQRVELHTAIVRMRGDKK
jgi:hypothetical protein